MDAPVKYLDVERDNATLKLLRQVPLFNALGAVDLEYISTQTRVRRLVAGEILYRKDDDPVCLFAVASGQMKLALVSLGGTERVIDLVGPGETFGEASLLLKCGHLFDAESLSKSQILCIPTSVVTQLCAKDVAFSRGIASRMATQVRSLVTKLEACSLMSGSQRVIEYLLALCPDEDEVKTEAVIVTLPVSKGTMASQLNLAPESLSRIFHNLIHSGLIRRQGKRMAITDLQRLRMLVGQQSQLASRVNINGIT